MSWGASGAKSGAVLVNMSALDSQPRLSSIRRNLGCEVLGTIPPAATAFERAKTSGIPLLLNEPGHIAAEAITEMAGRLANDPVEQTHMD
jgi:MinD-like ATPase involved in chromosome partitioning or flagellar assembly